MNSSTLTLWKQAHTRQEPERPASEKEQAGPTTTQTPRRRAGSTRERTGSSSNPRTSRSTSHQLIDRIIINTDRHLKLRGYQKLWLNQFTPQDLNWQLDDFTTISCQTAALVSFPGSGLTTVLAAKALERFRASKPVLICADHDHLKLKIAQAMVDLADSIAEKRRIQDALRFDLNDLGSHNHTIRIINPASLRSALSTDGDRTARLTALKRFKDIFLDAVHHYTDPNDYRQLLIDLVQNTQEGEKPRIYGLSSTPKDSGTSGSSSSFSELFPPTHVIEGLAREDLVRQGSRGISLEARIITNSNNVHANDFRQIFGNDYDNHAKILRISAQSANYQLAEQMSKDLSYGRIRIVAQGAVEADQLAQVMAARGLRAQVLVSAKSHTRPPISGKGYYERVEETAQKSSKDLKHLQITHADGSVENVCLRFVGVDESQAIQNFENGDRPIIIDYQILDGLNSLETNTVIFFNASTNVQRMLRALGPSSVQAPGPLRFIHYEITKPNNTDGADLQHSVDAELRWILSDPQPWSTFASAQAVASTSIAGTQNLRGISRPAILNQGSTTAAILLDTDTRWINEGLRPLFIQFRGNQDTDEARILEGQKKYEEKFREHFQGRPEIDLDLLYGRKIDPELFAEIIKFNQGLLNKAYPHHHLYSHLDKYRIHVASIAPHLVKLDGDPSDFAVPLVRAFLDREESERQAPNEAWLQDLNEALGLPREKQTVKVDCYSGNGMRNITIALGQAQRLDLIARKFTEVLITNYGQDFFKIPSNVSSAISALLGQANTNKFLFTYLLQNLNLSPSKLAELTQKYSNLTTSIPVTSFAQACESIRAQYPNPPQDPDKLKFFTQDLLSSGLNISLASLVAAAIEFSKNSEQAIQDPNTLREQVSVFLTEAERQVFAPELRRESRLEENIPVLVNRHLDPVCQEILFNQLIAKIWPDHDARKTTVASPHRASDVRPHEITTESTIAIKLDDRYKDINLLGANVDWLKLVMDAASRQVDIPGLSGLAIGNQARLVRAIDQFATSRALPRLSQDQLELLCGIQAPKNDTQKDLLRAFIKHLGLDETATAISFPDRLGIRTIDEAELIISPRLQTKSKGGPGVVTNNFDNSLDPGLFRNPRLIGEYLLKNNADALSSPEGLRDFIRIINGDRTIFDHEEGGVASQATFRRYVQFLETRHPELGVTVAAYINSHPKLTNILDIDELRATLKAKGYCYEPDAVGKEKNIANIDFMDLRTAKKDTRQVFMTMVYHTGKSPDELYALADLHPIPEDCLNEVIRLAQNRLGLVNTTRIEIDIDYTRTEFFKQKSLFHKLWPSFEQGTISIQFTHTEKQYPNIGNLTSQTSMIQMDWDTKILTIKEMRPDDNGEYQIWNTVSYEHNGTSWQETSRDLAAENHYMDEWIDQCIDEMNQGPSIKHKILPPVDTTKKARLKAFVKEKSKEIQDEHERFQKVPKIIRAAVGLGEMTRADQDLFREFVAWNDRYSLGERVITSQILLKELIAKFPQRTGIRNLEELRLVADQLYIVV